MIDSEGNTRIGAGAFLGESPFLVSAAHELKSPLALIRQLSLSLKSDLLSPDETNELAEQILLTSERALRLTSDLTKARTLEDSFFETEPINVAQILDEVAHELSPLFRAKSREIRVGKRTKPLLALANRELLRRVLLGFCDNALHYAGDDSVVQLDMARIGAAARLTVRDFGPAVPNDIWKRVNQGCRDNSATILHDRPNSSGLGLVIAAEFAKAMQGRIGVKRHRDGATFYIDVAASTQLSLL